MTLSLVTPLGSNFIKDFPFQNTENCDAIDAYAGPCLTTHNLQAWTPQLQGTSNNPVLGTGGFNRGFYYKIFDQVYVWGEFRFGSSGMSVALSGTWLMTLPFAVENLTGINGTIFGSSPTVGTGIIWDDSTGGNRLPLTVHLRSSNTVVFGFRMTSGAGSREVSNVAPPVLTWAALDGITWCARFKRVP